MKPYNEYVKEATRNKPYPRKADYTTVYVYEKGNKIFQGTLVEYNENKEVHGKTHEKVVDTDAYNKDMKEYNELNSKAQENFKKDVFDNADADLSNPHHQGLWDIIYQDYHSYADDIPNKFYDYMEAIWSR